MMEKYLRLLMIFLLSFTAKFSFSQVMNMGSGVNFPMNSPASCSVLGATTLNFADDGGTGGNYSANFNDTIVFCPDLTQGTKMSIAFSIDAGASFSVDGSDSIFVFDGPNTSAPMLGGGGHNSVTDPTGFTYTASWANPSGCLTVVFVTDGANESAGWLASVLCGNQPQPFEMHLEAFVNGSINNSLNPIDTGFVDVCFGDSILFVAKPLFPYSLESTGYGYSQNVGNVNYDWNISDGGTYPNNDSIWFVPPTRNGFLVELKITDAFPQSQRIAAKARVSQQPLFIGTGPLEDTVCVGESTLLIGGVTPTDTVGISIPPGSFELGGSYAGLTYLPDGSGQEYVTSINISGFPSDATLQNNQDLNQVCITMEHSYTGDLEIWLECPPVAPATTGQIVALLNSYSPGFLPAGTSGGSTFLGHPYDDFNGGGAGVGWEYCFSSVFNTIGPMQNNWANTVPVSFVAGTPPLSAGISMDPSDVYAPVTPFGTSLVGCPINGNWKIHVRDNIGADDGYIFEWGLFFDPSFFPGMTSYYNSAVDSYWTPDPTIISQGVDTVTTVMLNQSGPHSYIYNMIDDFGCQYDTTVVLFGLPLPTIFDDAIGCDFTYQVTGTQAYDGGVWYSTPAGLNFNTASSNNPNITAPGAGTYTVSFVDNACSDTVSSTIIFPPLPVIFDDTLLCANDYQVVNTQVYPGGGSWSSLSPEISFSPNNGVLNPTITASASGNYQVTFTDSICNNSVSSGLTIFLLPEIFPDTSACNFAYQVQGTYAANGGVWSSADTNIRFLPNANVLNPTITSSIPGTYTVTFTDNICGTSISSDIFFEQWAWTSLNDTLICAGSSTPIVAFAPLQNDDYLWSTGSTETTIYVSSPGVYYLTVSNECNSYTDSAVVGIKTCDINVPNIIVLSSNQGNNEFIINYSGVKEYHITIQNRWGNNIWESTNPADYWKGKTSNGNIVEEGVYFYSIKAVLENNEELEKQGFVHVYH